MGKLNTHDWHKLPLSLSELCINTTLRCGQSFRWRKSDEGVWSMALQGRVLSLHQDDTNLYYRSIFPTSAILPTPPGSTTHSPSRASSDTSKDDTLALVKHYLNLGPDLSALYTSWAKSDANFARRAPKFTGIRILRQDAWEALVGFICSSNNNIARISQMVDKLCRRWGTPLTVPYDAMRDDGLTPSPLDPDSQTPDTVRYYDFPSAASIAADPNAETTMRELGFGYRARYLAETARTVAAHPADWLDSLRNPIAPAFGQSSQLTSAAGEQPWNPTGGREGYRAAHAALLDLQGVGPKVADCVCLMGLGWGEAVPVDTHVWQIAVRDYKFGKGKHSSLTKATYDAVGDKFRTLWGQEAGWAHSVLFTADLRAFAERLVDKVVKTEKTVVKKEEDGTEAVLEAKEVKVLKKKIKREPEAEPEIDVTEISERAVRRAKRRRTKEH